MSLHNNTKIIVFVGLTGSGKTEAVNYVTAMGYPKVYFGGVLYRLMAAAGVPQGEENEKVFRENLRAEHGKDYYARCIIAEINDLVDAGQRHIIADGLYSWTEYKTMKHEFPGDELSVVALVSPRRIRQRRLANRPERPMTEALVNLRDWNEIEGIEKGGPIAIADHFIINDNSIEKLHQQIDAILDEIDFLK